MGSFTNFLLIRESEDSGVEWKVVFSYIFVLSSYFLMFDPFTQFSIVIPLIMITLLVTAIYLKSGQYIRNFENEGEMRESLYITTPSIITKLLNKIGLGDESEGIFRWEPTKPAIVMFAFCNPALILFFISFRHLWHMRLSGVMRFSEYTFLFGFAFFFGVIVLLLHSKLSSTITATNFQYDSCVDIERNYYIEQLNDKERDVIRLNSNVRKLSQFIKRLKLKDRVIEEEGEEEFPVVEEKRIITKTPADRNRFGPTLVATAKQRKQRPRKVKHVEQEEVVEEEDSMEVEEVIDSLDTNIPSKTEDSPYNRLPKGFSMMKKSQNKPRFGIFKK
ncbi:hypothetical protein PCE1_000598 [Barthelona sp. PCE]